ncbi:DUF1549 and DUF1553 domain-containing protein [Prosthecobacter dejongeii]|uniref:Cytochrome c domain-containing protein n=1 Tax=Prosthecobacter dejongeii TaxID=48465 RepID=A0A7W7YMF2_9BACT|nr:DUF1549 and DUF1553 domain-containing protein [Prosthecobacter dejongeii]MBB5038722.1 hypothetical protein [Prosthecobacter dejongeii]
MKLQILTLSLILGVMSAHGRAIRASTDPVKDEAPITAKDQEHWAFQPLPKKAEGSLDAFIEAQLTEAGLKRSPQAPAETLIRRITFDLTGLPPVPEQVAAFKIAFQKAPQQALEALMDDLLASPQYGEHWAQWWLDMARFAETDGFEHDRERSRAWQYRDWVVEALNKDQPFDDFVRQQIAGDLLPQGEAVATGFLFSGPDMPDLNNQDERRHVLLNEITTTVGSVFLGLTIGCAQCHDHAYDPLSQADFYRLRAFFSRAVLTKSDRPLGPSVREYTERVPASVVYVRGDFRRPGPAIDPGFPRIGGGLNQPAQDRTDLAHWITRPDNALFLRTMANRLWQQHFGRPLAPTPGDLGVQSEVPTHPALLNWLAAELPRQGWSLKKMHKLILMSATYQQTTQPAAMNEEAVNLYAAMPRRRLTGEMLRDAMLRVTGQLNLKAGGPGVHLPLPKEISGTLLKKQAAVTEDLTEQKRRSLYIFARRNARQPIFDLFDRPDALASCSRREQSTTAPQALLMMNSEFTQSMAFSLAQQAQERHGSDTPSLITWIAQRCFARRATAAEQSLGESFIQAQIPRAGSFQEALADYCLAVLNANEFVYID